MTCLKSHRWPRLLCAVFAFVCLVLCLGHRPAEVSTVRLRQMEKLGRGVVAVHYEEGKVFVGWRLLGTDPDGIAFNVYRKTAASTPVKLNAAPLPSATSLVDEKADKRR